MDPANFFLPECNPDPPVDIPEDPNIPSDPCGQVSALKNNSAFTDRLNTLRSLTNGNFEAAYTFNFTTYTFNYAQGTPGQHFVAMAVTNPIEGYAHNHFSGGDPIFSDGDIELISILANNNKISDLSKFTLAVTTHSGTEYLLKISNVSAFNTFNANILNNPTAFGAWSSNYYQLATTHQANGMSNTDAFEKAFLQAILGNGLALFRANSSHTNFEKKELDSSNNSVTVPCP